MKEILQAFNIAYRVNDGKNVKVLFENCSLSFDAGKFYCLLGESGSGKTTFLHLLAGLDKPDKGHILYRGKDIQEIERNNYLRDHVSIIFQDYNLIPYMNVYQNIAAAMAIKKLPYTKESIAEMLKKVKLDTDIMFKRINLLSGGEKQRVAIVRALVGNNDIILADEPTGNLDSDTAKEIIALLKTAVCKQHKTLIVVSHSELVAESGDVVYILDQKIKGFVPKS